MLMHVSTSLENTMPDPPLRRGERTKPYAYACFVDLPEEAFGAPVLKPCAPNAMPMHVLTFQVKPMRSMEEPGVPAPETVATRLPKTHKPGYIYIYIYNPPTHRRVGF